MSESINGNWASRAVIVAQVYGKSSCLPGPSKCRSILPLPCLLTIADSLLSNRVLSFLNSHLQPGVHALLGGLPGTQCLDICTAAHLVVEKGLDPKRRGAIAQADPERYYDNLNPLTIARYLIPEGSEPGVAVSCVKCQLSPCVNLAVCGGVYGDGVRTKGALTGDRVAGALGYTPVCEAMTNARGAMQTLGFKFDEGKFLACASWIDNLFTFSNSFSGAVRVSEVLEHNLWARCGFAFQAWQHWCFGVQNRTEPE